MTTRLIRSLALQIRQLRQIRLQIADVIADPFRVVIGIQITLAAVAQQGDDRPLLAVFPHLFRQLQRPQTLVPVEAPTLRPSTPSSQ